MFTAARVGSGAGRALGLQNGRLLWLFCERRRWRACGFSGPGHREASSNGWGYEQQRPPDQGCVGALREQVGERDGQAQEDGGDGAHAGRAPCTVTMAHLSPVEGADTPTTDDEVVAVTAHRPQPGRLTRTGVLHHPLVADATMPNDVYIRTA